MKTFFIITVTCATLLFIACKRDLSADESAYCAAAQEALSSIMQADQQMDSNFRDEADFILPLVTPNRQLYEFDVIRREDPRAKLTQQVIIFEGEQKSWRTTRATLKGFERSKATIDSAYTQIYAGLECAQLMISFVLAGDQAAARRSETNCSQGRTRCREYIDAAQNQLREEQAKITGKKN